MECCIDNLLSCINSAIGVDFNFSGSAFSGSAEVRFPSSVTISGDVQCVNITIEDDMIVEGDHTIALELAPGLESPLGQIDFNPMSSIIVIEDNDGKSNVYACSETKIYELDTSSTGSYVKNIFRHNHTEMCTKKLIIFRSYAIHYQSEHSLLYGN